jgi:NitT/TauT family transport system ATP-binding protein
LKLKNINKSFENFEVLKNFSIEIKDNKTTCLFGKSGCGKTTLMNIMCGIIKDYDGEINPITKEISVVFQETRLLPWFTVAKNISIVSKKYLYYLDAVELLEFQSYYPENLSGGMRQRLNIARALSVGFDILIMDEPFKGIDLTLKTKIMNFIKNETKNKTVIFTTHDYNEALYLSDEIVYLDGPPLKITKIQQINNS